MLLVSIGIWCVAIFSLRIALFGNPLYTHLKAGDSLFVRHLDALSTSGRGPGTHAEVVFLRRFVRLLLLEIGLLVLEIGLLSYLWFSQVAEWLSLGLLLKDLAVLALGGAAAHRYARKSLFESILAIPSWMVWTDRVSALVSGMGALLIFGIINQLLVW